MYTNMHQQNNCQSLTNRSYGFKELAVLYFPNIAPASASIRLKQWIRTIPNYSKHCRKQTTS